MIDLSLLFPKAESYPIPSKVIDGANTDLLNGKFLFLTGKTSELIKQLKPGQRLEQLHQQLKGRKAYFAFSRLHPDKPSRSIVKDSAGLFHYLENRTLTVGEYKRIASFPDRFEFIGSFNSALLRMGNSVPPLFMRSIARQIKHIMFNGDNPNVTLKKIDYLPFLEACWQEHLKPKPPDAPTVISLFAGCGGSSLGYSMAGFRELLAVEWDNNAVETFKLNFPDIPVYHGDICELSVDECLRLTGLKPGELDILDGSPPCQGFSTAGKRIMEDDRNQLFREYVRLLRGLKPKVFVMENVSGMVKGKMKLIFAEIMRELKASDYMVSARLLNAMYFNVPQSRQRLIFIGVRNDLGIEPSHPKAESRPVTVKEALDNVNITIPCKNPDGFWQETIWPQIKPGKNGINGKYFNTGRLHWNKPLQTLCKSTSFAGFPGLIMPDENRGISIDEAKRIGSFSDNFNLLGTYSEQYERIGNSVPPLFMRSIANHIRTNILSSLAPAQP